MEKYIGFFYVLIILAANSFSEESDSTDLIFKDDNVHSFELHYYVQDWVKQMEANKADSEKMMPAKFIYHLPSGDSMVLDSIGVRYKGNSSYTLAGNNPKKSFKLGFDEYKDQTFFNCHVLNLNNCIEDPSYMREKIGYDIIRKFTPAPRVAYASLSVNDTLVGVFTQVEQVDKYFLKRNFDKDGGSLFKAADGGAGLDYKGPNKDSYKELYEIKRNEDDENAWNHFITMLYNSTIP
jgi:spore coat protein CotH